jgi:hypothetical protein
MACGVSPLEGLAEHVLVVGLLRVDHELLAANPGENPRVPVRSALSGQKSLSDQKSLSG